MIKHIKKVTMLLFVAATMINFTSCGKDKENEVISESSLVGEWGWTSTHPYMHECEMVIGSDHKVTCKNHSYRWSFNGNTFTARNEDNMMLEFVIKSPYGDKMIIMGSEKTLRSDGTVYSATDISGVIIKTDTIQLPTLTESIMVGTWSYVESAQMYPDKYEVIIKADHTFENQTSHRKGTWRIEGSKFIGTEKKGNYDGSDREFSFTAISMISSAKKVVLAAIEGKDGYKTFVGTFTKTM